MDLGFVPKLPLKTGKYASIEWNTLRTADNTINVMEQWKVFVNGPSCAQLHFPPLILPEFYGSEIIILYLMRHVNDIIIYGGYHKNASKDLPPQEITLELDIEVVNKDKTVLKFNMNKVVTIHYEKQFGYSALYKWNCESWSNINDLIGPKVNISILPLQSSESPNFVCSCGCPSYKSET
jgi:hypothetical protein